MHFLFISVFAAAYQLPVEGNFKDGRNNIIKSADIESCNTCVGYANNGDGESLYGSCVRFWVVELSG
jgi:hypothetical protein